MNKKKVAILYHIFYEDTILHLSEQLKELSYFDPLFLFNISADSPEQLGIRETLLVQFPGCIVTISSNQGKDIGAKLLLLRTCIQLDIEPDWFILLHDKKSLQALNAKTWKNDLLKIIDRSEFEKINDIISTQTDCGIIAPANYIIPETREQGNFIGNNAAIMNMLLKTYQVTPSHFEYVAGTMFWAKAKPLLDFFKSHDPLNIRQSLEPGNVLDNFSGSNTHSWERMLSWIIIGGGLTIKSI